MKERKLLAQKKSCKILEAQKMISQGMPLSVIARVLKVRISDILHLDNPKALGK